MSDLNKEWTQEQISSVEETAEQTPPTVEETPEQTQPVAEETTEQTEATSEETVEQTTSSLTEESKEKQEPEEPLSEEEFLKRIQTRKPYKDNYYLLYGNESAPPENIDLSGTLAFLQKLGYGDNPLKQAREGKKLADLINAGALAGSGKHCSFCGIQMIGTEYDVLRDGRMRCPGCSRSIIQKVSEFENLFDTVKANMEKFFDIQFGSGIQLQMVNAKKLHKGTGNNFVPNGKGDPRILGYAQKGRHGNMTLVIENGSPRMAAIKTMVHEMTHIWQYQNWNAETILKTYGRAQNLEIYEGMAKWVEIQYCFLLGETDSGKLAELETLLRDDEYGHGFIKYCDVYPLTYGTVLEGDTPFTNKQRPL